MSGAAEARFTMSRDAFKLLSQSSEQVAIAAEAAVQKPGDRALY